MWELFLQNGMFFLEGGQYKIADKLGEMHQKQVFSAYCGS